jgi:hypothetical protein
MKGVEFFDQLYKGINLQLLRLLDIVIFVMSRPHAARGNNAQARGKLQIADVTQQRAYEPKNWLPQ